jgi:hypothetical protein
MGFAALYPSYGATLRRNQIVGWVERGDTHRVSHAGMST